MHCALHRVFALLISLLLTNGLPVHAQGTAPAVSSAGSVTFKVGAAQLLRDGRTTDLAAGQALVVGDTLVTGADGHIHARMVDGGFIAVRPGSKFAIQAYTYNPADPSANRVGLQLESGVARTISGKAGEANRDKYRFNTPVAAIGLRGTDYVVHATGEFTRVSVLKGAVTLSAYGPGCLAAALSPCAGPLTRELAAGVPHAYMEVRAKGGAPVLVPPSGAKDAPGTVAPPRPEESSARVAPQGGTTLASSGARTDGPVAPQASLTDSSVVAKAVNTVPALVESANAAVSAKTAADAAEAARLAAAQLASLPHQILWGRWSSANLPAVPTVASVANAEREVTFGNNTFALFRPAGDPALPATGVVAMQYAQGDAYVRTQAPGSEASYTPAALSQGRLQLDFNNRQFTTSLQAAVNGTSRPLYASGNIQFQGYLYSDAARSNINLAGALSNNAAEAGYVFDTALGTNQALVGVTRWRR